MRTTWILHNGKQILFSDFTNLSAAELHAELDLSDAVIMAQPHNSVLALTNLAGTKGTAEALEYYRQSGLKTTPHIRHSAIVGVTGLRRALVDLVTRVTGAQVRVLGSLEEARDWLTAQD